jgi:hypothetical protein
VACPRSRNSGGKPLFLTCSFILVFIFGALFCVRLE